MVNTTVPAIRGGKNFRIFLDGKAYENGADAAYNLCSQYGRDAGLLRNGLHTGDVGKAYAQDNRKAGAQMETVLIA